MDLGQNCGRWRSASRESDSRLQRDAGYPQLSVGVLFHDSDRVVLVGIDDDPLARADREKGEYVTGRGRCDERFFRIDAIDVAFEGGRGGGGDDDRALVEAHVVRAVVGIVKEIRTRARPAHGSMVFAHAALRACSRYSQRSAGSSRPTESRKSPEVR